MNKSTLKNNNLLIGVSGSIAAYKTCFLINQLKRYDNDVKVVMTKSAKEFISAKTFEALTENKVCDEVFDESNDSISHITLANWCDLLLISPSTANTINKIASGIADDLLPLISLSLPNKTPVIIAPAMNVNMWENKIMQDKISYLKSIQRTDGKPKFYFVEPREGKLACGVKGKGALARTEDILENLDKHLNK